MTDETGGGPGSADIRFLIVDDDEVAVMAFRRAITKMNLGNWLETAKDGVEALDVLSERRRTGSVSSYVVLLDINMPRMNGHEFLDAVARDPHLRGLRIFVLTTSDAPEDIMQAHKKEIAGYVLKDCLRESFAQMLVQLNISVD